MPRGRPSKYNYCGPDIFKTECGRRAFNTHITRLKHCLATNLEAYVRRFCCLVCCSLYSIQEVQQTERKYAMEKLSICQNMDHVKGMASVYPYLDLRVFVTGNQTDRVGFYICKQWCLKRWKTTLSQSHDVPMCPSLEPLRPFWEIPYVLRSFCGVEAGTLSLIDMTVNLGGGVGKGHYFALHGDFRADEDLAGCVGTTVGRMKLSRADLLRVKEAIVSLRRDGRHQGVQQFLLTCERNRYEIGMSLCEPNAFRGNIHEGRGQTSASYNMIGGHAIPRVEHICRSRMRFGRRLNLRAGVLYERGSGTPRPVFWNSDIEVLLFPQLYLNGIGGFLWSQERGLSWTEHVRKRIWSINPMFRKTTLYLTFLFDFGEKCEMHRLNEKAFIPDHVDECDAEEFSFMSERSALGFENVCRRQLSRGRRGVAAASEMLGKPNIFQTETMNEADMAELKTMSFQLIPGNELTVDDVTIAILYKARQIALLECVLPKTTLKGVEHGSVRLEIQSGRSYRLHAHNMIRVSANDDEIMNAVSASLTSLSAAARKAYEPVSKHRCLSYKCGNDCAYGYPVLTPAERTHREYEDSDDTEGKVIYKRFIGEGGIEKDERVTPFSVELSSVRVCHGAFLVCDDELATGYSGKYSFKKSGGMANEVGQLALGDVVGGGDVQLLRKEEEGWKSQMMKEKLGMRIISIMEIALHLCGESIVHSTYFVRELWIVLPFDRKKFLDKGVLRKGIPGGAQLRDYYKRRACFEDDTFESYYGRGCVAHPADYENDVQICTDTCNGRCEYREGSLCNTVFVKGVRKQLLARIMPIRGRGRFLVDMVCWSLILKNVPHRETSEVWKYTVEELSWDAAARTGALGNDKMHLKGGDAVRNAMTLGVKKEDSFGKKMGYTEIERERIRSCFKEALNEVLKDLYAELAEVETIDNLERQGDQVENRPSRDQLRRTESHVGLGAVETDIDYSHLEELNEFQDAEVVREWRKISSGIADGQSEKLEKVPMGVGA